MAGMYIYFIDVCPECNYVQMCIALLQEILPTEYHSVG